MLTVYSASAIGVPLHYHYCKGELQHITLFTQKECDSHEEHEKEVEKSPFSCCLANTSDHCGMADESDCCDDESDLIQLDDEAAAISVLPFFDAELSSVAVNFDFISIQVDKDVIGYNAHAPPLTGPKIYLANCSFVFYG